MPRNAVRGFGIIFNLFLQICHPYGVPESYSTFFYKYVTPTGFGILSIQG